MAKIHDRALVHPGAELAADVEVGPFAVVGEHVRLGPGVKVMSGAVLDGRTTVGAGCKIHPQAAVGCEPQDLKYRGEPTELVIGERTILREFVTISVGTVGGGGVTRIGSDCLIMACAHVAHDCQLGDKVVMDNAVLLAGHVTVEDCATLSGAVAIHQFTTVGRVAFVGGMTRVVQDVPPFTIVEGDSPLPRMINAVGLRKHGYQDEAIESLKDAFRLLFRSDDLSRAEALEKLKLRGKLTPEVDYLGQFLKRMEKGRHGRALEAQRQKT